MANNADEVARLKESLDREVNHNMELRRQRDEAKAEVERLKAHDVSHPGPCCVREVLRVDIKGRALTEGRK